jgi:hypothetical protein
MAEIFLTWREAGSGDLPEVCVSCGEPATDLASRRLCVSRHGIFVIRTRSVTVRLPFCPEHRQASWVYFSRVVAKKIEEEGITLAHVSEDFIDALWDYREGGGRRRRRRPPERWEEDEDPDRPAGGYRRPRRLPEYRPPPSNAVKTVGIILLVLFLVGMFCAGGMVLVVLFLLRR